MAKRSLVTTLFWVLLTSSITTAQNLCPLDTSSSPSGDKLICFLPQAYAKGLTLAPGPHQGHFGEVSFVSSSLTPLNSTIGRQSTLLPLASPSSGITFTWNSAGKVFIPSTDSLGPILGERAETLGRYRVFLGFSYQYFKFDSIDGLELNSPSNFPAVFTHQDDSVDIPTRTCSVNGDNTGNCGFVRDVVRTNSEFDLKIHQFTTFVTFGLTNRIDVSMAIPIENVRMGVSSSATIVNNSNKFLHRFPLKPSCDTSEISPCFSNSFSEFRSASGIGDITLRVKGTAWKGERAGLALGVDIRTPTGDELDFLGSGAFGVRPFVVWSYRSRISPHVLVGYETNGSSVVAGDILTGQKAKLPGQLTYSGGADVWITKRLSAAFDLVGQQVFEAQRMSVGTFTELGACADSSCVPPFATPNTDPNLSPRTGSYNVTNASVGVKIKPFANLLVTGNATFKLNDGGLRAKVVPLVAVSYTF